MAEVALSAVMAEMAEPHISSGHTVWWNGTTWCWHAWFNGYNGTGSQEWALDAELRAMEWISMQGREPLAKVLDDVHRLRKELGWTGEV